MQLWDLWSGQGRIGPRRGLAELDLTMALTGWATIAEITRGVVTPRP